MNFPKRFLSALAPRALALSLLASSANAAEPPRLLAPAGTESFAAFAERARQSGGWAVQVGADAFGFDGPASMPAGEVYAAQGHESTLPPLLLERRIGSAEGFHFFHFPDGPPPALERLAPPGGRDLCRSFSGQMIRLGHGMSLSRLSPPAAASRGGSGIADEDVQALVDQVDPARYLAGIQDLADFGSRNTFNPGNADARDWLRGEFEALGLTVETPLFQVFGSDAYNVVARLEGSQFPSEFVVIGAHFDSLPGSGSPAPGAEDNGSGTAALLEIAKILAPFGTQRSVVFVAFSGEEQGLHGSDEYVANLSAAERANLQGAIIMDMVSYTADAQIDVLLETSSSGFGTRALMAQAAADFTGLTVFQSDFPFGSDHVPFLDAGLPALLAIENDWDVYPCYHQSCDAVGNVDQDQGAEIVRMCVGAAARLANPQPVPVELSAFSLE